MAWKNTKDRRIKKNGDVYYARFSKKGVRIEQSLHTSSFQLAVELVDQIEQMLKDNKDYRELFSKAVQEKDEVPLISELWTKFIEDKTAGRRSVKKVRANTLKGYEIFWSNYYEDFFGNKTLAELDADLWDKYLDYVRETCSSGDRTKFLNHWKYFSAFCKWAVVTERMSKMPPIYNPDLNKKDTEDDGVGINYTDEELREFREHSKYHKQFHLCVLMAQYMGMRSSEITQLKKSRIDLKKWIIGLKAVDTKTKQARQVPIHPEVRAALKAQMDERMDSPFLFPNAIDPERPMDTTGFKKPWNAIRSKLGISGRFHDFRHSYATRAFANKDLNPVLVCKALGMSMKVAMDTYIHYDENQMSSITANFKL